jgi:hypothetical protein
MRRGAQRAEEAVQPWYIIDPDSLFWRSWNLLQALSIMYLMIATPSEQLRRLPQALVLQHCRRPRPTTHALRQLFCVECVSTVTGGPCPATLCSAYLVQKPRHAQLLLLR